MSAAYLIRFENMTADDAVARLRAGRPMVKPNRGFLRQLRLFEDLERGRRLWTSDDVVDAVQSGDDEGDVWTRSAHV